MKAVLVGPVYPYRGGIAHYTTMLYRALREHGHDVLMVSFKRQYPRCLYPGKSDRDPSRTALHVNAEYLLDPLYPWTWWQTVRRIVQFKPDTVVIQWWTTFWAPAFAALAYLLRRKGLLILFLVHNVLPHEARPWDVWLVRMVLSQGQAFIVQTAEEKRRLLSFVPSASVTICHHPIYDMFSNQHIPKEEAKRRLNLPADVPVVLFFGIVRPYKGLKYLVDAVALLRDWGKVVYLVVAGEFWQDKTAYLQQIARLNLSEWVRLEDRYIPNEEVGLFFSAADVFAAPYVGGTQSGAVGMALGWGVPIVVTEELARGLPNGTFSVRVVQAGDSRRLALEIQNVLDKDGEDGTDALLAKSIIAESWGRLVNSIEELVIQDGVEK